MKRIQGSIGISLLIGAIVAVGCTNDGTSENSRNVVADRSHSVTPVKHPVSRTMVIPAGTNVAALLETSLSTDTNHTGDRFHATTVDAILVDGKTVVPAGSQIHGVLQDVQASGKIKGRARMTLDFQTIEDSRGTSHAISAQPLTLQAESRTKGDVEKIAAGGVVGAIIGGIAGGSKGAAIGAGAGAGAGTILMLATKGEDLEIGAGRRLNVYITSPASIVLVAQK